MCSAEPKGSASDAMDDAQLASGLAASEPSAVEQFLRRSHHSVYAIACRLSADRERRADWTHDTLLGLLDDLRLGRFEYRGPGSFWGWFRKRAYYRLLDAYRKAKLAEHRETAVGGAAELSELGGAIGSDDPVRELERVRVRSALERCLDALENGSHRRAVQLRLIDDCTYETIAETMATPLNTVRAWIRRGRLALRRCLVEALGLGEQPFGPSGPLNPRREDR